MKNHKEVESNQPYHPEIIHFLKPHDNNNINQSIDINNNINEDIDNVIDDIYFEPAISEPYTRRSEKRYDEDINYNENDNS
jgi:hypothetical protein